MMETRLAKMRKLLEKKEVIPPYDGPSPFDVLPTEILYKILDLLYGNPTKTAHFEDFWSLKFVNKEMYALLSTDYAQKRYIRSVCDVYISSAYDDDEEEESHEYALSNVRVEVLCKDRVVGENMIMRWSELPEYILSKNLRVKRVVVLYTPMGEEAFQTIKVLSDQSIKVLKVVIQDSPYVYFISTKYLPALKPLITSRKIKIRFFKPQSQTKQGMEQIRQYRLKMEKRLMMERSMHYL